MKNLIKSALLGIAMILSVNFAFGQEITLIKPPCVDNLYVTFPTAIGPVVPANTVVDFIIYFKPEYVSSHGESTIIRHEGYTMDIATPFTYPDFCNYYSINKIRAVQFKVYFEDGRTCSYPYGGYINSYVVSLPGIGTPGGSTTE